MTSSSHQLWPTCASNEAAQGWAKLLSATLNDDASGTFRKAQALLHSTCPSASFFMIGVVRPHPAFKQVLPIPRELSFDINSPVEHANVANHSPTLFLNSASTTLWPTTGHRWFLIAFRLLASSFSSIVAVAPSTTTHSQSLVIASLTVPSTQTLVPTPATINWLTPLLARS